MKCFWLVSCLTLLSTLCHAGGSVLSDTKKSQPVYVASPYQSEISFRSQRLPAWRFGVRYNRELPYHDQWVDKISTYHSVDSVRVSASRSLLKDSSQRIFAALQTSNDQQAAYSDWLYLPYNAGTAASVGWQIGELNSVKMAVEYQYREVSDKDINSLLLGVQYYF